MGYDEEPVKEVISSVSVVRLITATISHVGGAFSLFMGTSHVLTRLVDINGSKSRAHDRSRAGRKKFQAFGL